METKIFIHVRDGVVQGVYSDPERNGKDFHIKVIYTSSVSKGRSITSDEEAEKEIQALNRID